MVWLKRISVFFVSIFFLVLLLTFSLVTSLVISLSHPTKIEDWLSHSGLYGSVLSSAVNQASTVIATNIQPYGISVSRSTIQKIAQKSLTHADLENYTTTFLNANYNWLKGTTSTPEFSIDLTSIKQSFARQMGQYITTRLDNVPVCTATQTTTELAGNDFQTLSCLPASISPTAAGDYATKQLETSKQFIGNNVITAQTLSPDLNAKTSKPYYEQLSQAPTYFQGAEKLPYVIAGLIILCAIGIIFLSANKRKGLRRIAIFCIEIGAILIIITSLSSIAFAAAKNSIIGQKNSQIIEQSILSVINQVELQVNRINDRIGVGYIVFGILLVIILLATIERQKKLSAEQKSFLHDSPSHLAAPYLDKENEQTHTGTVAPAKRPRLIQ